MGGTFALVTFIESLDIDANGARDLVFTYYSGPPNPFKGGIVAVLMNNGTGQFTRLPESALPNSVFDIGQPDIWVATLKVMDWNRDGRDDLVVTTAFCPPTRTVHSIP